MADAIEFQLNLQGQMTAMLKSGADQADRLEGKLVKAADGLHKVEKGEKDAATAAEKFHEHLEHIVERFAEFWALEHAVELVREFTKELVASTIEITDFGFKAEIALRHLNNETEGAQEKTTHMLQEARKFATDASLPVEEVTESFLGLKRAGLSDEWARPLTAAAADLAGLSGHPERFHAINEEFEQIALRGELGGRALMSLQRDGINTAALAAKLGAKDFKDLQKQLSEHPLGALEGLRAIQEVIKETAHEDYLGQVAREQGRSFGGAFTRIKDTWTELVDGLNENPLFREMRDDFGNLADDIVRNLPAWEKEFAVAFDPVIKGFDEFLKHPNAVKAVFDAAIGGAQTIGSILGKIGDFAQWASKDIVFDLKHGLHTEEHQAGHGSFQDFVHGSKEAQKWDAAHQYADGGPVEETGPALIHSGEHVVPVGGALVMRESGGGGGGGGRSIHAPITVHMDLRGTKMVDPAGMKLMLEELLPGQLVSPLERLVATVGGS